MANAKFVFVDKDRLDRWANGMAEDIPYKVDYVIDTLLHEAVTIAESGYDRADYAGNSDVQVRSYKDGEEHIVEANGEKVWFVEFGAGVTQPPYPDESMTQGMVGMVGRGQYGKGHGAHPPWYYKTTGSVTPSVAHWKRNRDGTYSDIYAVTWGHPPARAMYNAAQHISKDNIVKGLKRVFKNDRNIFDG